MLVSGEAGIGKSALVRRFAGRHAADAWCLLGVCDPLLTPRALGPLHDIARQTNAAALGYEPEALSYDVEGDLDLRDFVGIGQGPRPGFTAIRVRGPAKAATPARSSSTSCAATSRRPLRWETSSPTRCRSRSR